MFKSKEKLDELNLNFPLKLKKSILGYAIKGKLVEQNLEDESIEILLQKIRQEKQRPIKDKKIKADKFPQSTIFIGADNYAIIMSNKGEPMPQIVPIRDLRNTNEISQLCHAKDEPIFVTKNGYGDLVVMSMKTYDSLTKISDIDNAISSSEAKIKDKGSLLDAKDALKSLRGKYFE